MRPRSTLVTLAVFVLLVALMPIPSIFAASQTRLSASDDGTTRVIVELQVAYQPEGTLDSAQDVEAQRSTIAQAQSAVWASLDQSGATVVQQFASIPFMALNVDAAELNVLRNSPAVASVEEDSLLTISAADNTDLIGAPAAWAEGYSGAGQTVAILDTGVDKAHPFLAGKVVSEACYSNGNGFGGGTSVCPGGVPQSIAAGSGVNCQLSGCEHGTHVAGIAAGRGPNFSGVARDATIIAIQVFTRFDGDYCGAGVSSCIASYTSDQLAALERVYTLRNTFSIAAVNMSLGGRFSTTNCDTDARKAMIDTLRAANIATVVAAGNDGHADALSYPACISSAISVGSVMEGGAAARSYDDVSSFSNSAAFLKLLAPGETINSSVPGGTFSTLSGTSMAAPHVAGAWAVLKSALPSATVAQVLSALTTSGVPITDTRNNITTPRIQVDAAVQALVGLPSISVNSVATLEGDTGTSSAVFTVSLSAASTRQITVTYATADNTARASSDYSATVGTLIFPTGVTVQTIVVPVNGDHTAEPDETFFITLTNVTNAAFGAKRGVATIVNDDIGAAPLNGNAYMVYVPIIQR